LKASAADAGGSVAELTLRVAETLARLHQARDVQVGTTAKRAVLSVGNTTLYQYLPLTRGGAGCKVAPLLICFALVNRPYVLDLQPDRSLVRRLRTLLRGRGRDPAPAPRGPPGRAREAG